MEEKRINTIVGERIRALRKYKGMTQSQLAEAIGVTYQQVQKYEKGATAITVERLYQIAEALSVAPSEILPEAEEGPSRVKETEGPYGYEQEVVRLFRELSSSEVRRAILVLLRALAEEK